VIRFSYRIHSQLDFTFSVSRISGSHPPQENILTKTTPAKPAPKTLTDADILTTHRRVAPPASAGTDADRAAHTDADIVTDDAKGGPIVDPGGQGRGRNF